MVFRRIPAALAALLLVAGVCPARAADASDPAGKAMEIAMMIGEAEALADICTPPRASYEQRLMYATKSLNVLYKRAGLDPGEIPSDIEEGRQDEAARHNDLAWPLNCNRFQDNLLAIEMHIARARNEQASSSSP